MVGRAFVQALEFPGRRNRMALRSIACRGWGRGEPVALKPPSCPSRPDVEIGDCAESERHVELFPIKRATACPPLDPDIVFIMHSVWGNMPCSTEYQNYASRPP